MEKKQKPTPIKHRKTETIIEGFKSQIEESKSKRMIQTEAENRSPKINVTDTRYEYPAHNCSEAGLQDLYALFEAGEYQLVLSSAAKMGDDHPHLGEIAYIIGLTHTRLGDPQQALVAYTIAQKSKFDTPYVQHNIAEAFRLLQHPKEAVLHYQKAIELLPNFPEAQLGWLFKRDQGKQMKQNPH